MLCFILFAVQNVLRSIILLLIVLLIKTKLKRRDGSDEILEEMGAQKDVIRYCTRANIQVDVRPNLIIGKVPEYADFEKFDTLIEIPRIIHQVGESHKVSKIFQVFIHFLFIDNLIS